MGENTERGAPCREFLISTILIRNLEEKRGPQSKHNLRKDLHASLNGAASLPFKCKVAAGSGKAAVTELHASRNDWTGD